MFKLLELSSEEWDVSDDDAMADIEHAPTQNFVEDQKLKIFVRWIMVFISRLRILYSLSDVACNFILKFLSTLLAIFNKAISPGNLIVAKVPSSIYMMRQMLGGIKEFTQFVVCHKCHHIYELENCKDRNGLSKRCLFVLYPNHPQRRMRESCDTLLLKTVELSSGKKILYPYLTYCYLSIETSLQSLLQRPSFVMNCNKWKTREATPGVLQDVYDGRLWKEFEVYNDEPFLSKPHNFAFTINLDWFQPFKHSTYSIGAVYMTVMNLPRELRNKQENILLVGLLPGPSEPSKINSYLNPLVNELNEFWQGKELKIYNESGKKMVRCALLCASCDLLAGRKLCGFLSYTAHHGCSCCKKIFMGSTGGMDYSGFDRDTWLMRNATEHRHIASEILSCTTKSAITTIESESGYRYTELLRLPYFDPSRMLAIDPMHNLFLGTGKHTLKNIWMKTGLITESNFDVIQARIDKTICHPDIGQIPNKVHSGFASFTADQYKNWIIHFSLLSLRDILSGPDLECWWHFILACRYLCSRKISQEHVILADALLLQFCRCVECMYGKDSITPNMHMHTHLRDCLLDYGPTHGFWLFSFERFNGILENLPNNNRSIEIQVMRRFVESSMDITEILPDEYQEDFSSMLLPKRVVGTMCDDFHPSCSPTSPSHQSALSYWCMNSQQSVPKYSSRGIFTQVQIVGLKQLYSELIGIPESDIEVPATFVKYQQVTVHGKLIGACKSRSKSSSLVLAMQKQGMEERPASVKYFAKHIVTIQSIQHTFLLFHCWWHKPRIDKNQFGKPVTIWESDVYELDDHYSIIPIQTITCRTISLVDKLPSGETVLFVSPCIDF